MEIGLENNIVKLAPYTPEWPELFAQEKAALAIAFADLALDIQHIGSTAVSGMIAKPIIDIAVAVANFETAAGCINPVEQLGYIYRGENGIPRRHYFVKGDPVAYHLHVLEESSREWHAQLVFRDLLRSKPRLAKEYAQLKLALAKQYPSDREAYTDAKGEFIRRAIFPIDRKGKRSSSS